VVEAVEGLSVTECLSVGCLIKGTKYVFTEAVLSIEGVLVLNSSSIVGALLLVV